MFINCIVGIKLYKRCHNILEKNVLASMPSKQWDTLIGESAFNGMKW